jgi:predicted ester cyclase
LRLVAEADFVVCHNTWTGTYDGTRIPWCHNSAGQSLLGRNTCTSTGSPKGKITEHWVVRDDLAMMQQIGAIT